MPRRAIIAPVRRWNSEGITREELLRALRVGEPVRTAIAKGQCMLCKGRPVSSAGLCEGCAANLTDDEIRAATPWFEGTRT